MLELGARGLPDVEELRLTALPERGVEVQLRAVKREGRLPIVKWLLIAGPPSAWFTASKFAGVPQGSAVLARVETQMSTEGWPGWPDMPLSGFGVEPGRSEVKYISSPSRLIEGFWSLYLLLTSKTSWAGPNVPSGCSVLA